MNTDLVVIDSSVLVAIFKRESDVPHLMERLLSFDRRLISAVNFLESAIVCEEWGKPAGQQEYDRMVSSLQLEVAPATAAQTEIARDAHRRFGKGRGRPAVLNFGDCFAYALAKNLGAPLLYKGDDFAQTDIPAA
ncbi:MAG: type II toxin-antitoxin system VapC family toxin [Alphaproteobacteria bacterium]